MLKMLRMEIASNLSETNFSDIASTAPENIYISYVDHMATVEVNEQGNEAAVSYERRHRSHVDITEFCD